MGGRIKPMDGGWWRIRATTAKSRTCLTLAENRRADINFSLVAVSAIGAQSSGEDGTVSSLVG